MTDGKNEKPSGITPSATVGPYYAYGLTPMGKYTWKDTGTPEIAPPGTEGEAIRIEGRVLHGDGKVIPDAMLEFWQADAKGRYNAGAGAASNVAFRGWGRVGTNGEGRYAVMTVKPGAVAGPKGQMQAPHILVAVFARGVVKHLYTRVYFAEDGAQHASDAVLSLVPAARRKTLIATKSAPGIYTFDIRLQGGDETVFFDV
ncbi:MAG: protocatechuate 3,4-dioxygenase subunit alpha [Pseudomonadota bacterium]